MTDDVSRLFAEFEALGEDEVRQRLAAGTPYSSRLEIDAVHEWLRQQDQRRSDEESRLSRSSNAEHITIARSARDAAWAAAEAARKANTRATIALVIAAISAAVLIIDNLLGH